MRQRTKNLSGRSVSVNPAEESVITRFLYDMTQRQFAYMEDCSRATVQRREAEIDMPQCVALPATLYEKLRLARLREGWSSRAAGRAVGISHTLYLQLERAADSRLVKFYKRRGYRF